MKITYPLIDGPLDGEGITLPFRLAFPSRLFYNDDMGNQVGHYYACMVAHPDAKAGDPEEAIDWQAGYAWKEEAK